MAVGTDLPRFFNSRRDGVRLRCGSLTLAYEPSPSIQVHWLPGGDHGFTPRKASGRTEEQNWEEGGAVVERFTSALAIRS